VFELLSMSWLLSVLVCLYLEAVFLEGIFLKGVFLDVFLVGVFLSVFVVFVLWLFVCVFFGVLFLWDVLLFLFSGGGFSSVSVTLLTGSGDRSIVPFAMWCCKSKLLRQSSNSLGSFVMSTNSVLFFMKSKSKRGEQTELSISRMRWTARM